MAIDVAKLKAWPHKPIEHRYTFRDSISFFIEQFNKNQIGLQMPAFSGFTFGESRLHFG